MTFLVDTHLLLWAAAGSARLSERARLLLDDPSHRVFFSTASIWEAAIKYGLRRADFPVEPSALRRALLGVGYEELLITSDHAVAVANLPAIHRDPFDRLLVAQALVEGITLITSDPVLASYPGALEV